MKETWIGCMKETWMPPAKAVANSGNTIYGVGVIMEPNKLIIELNHLAWLFIIEFHNHNVFFSLLALLKIIKIHMLELRYSLHIWSR